MTQVVGLANVDTKEGRSVNFKGIPSPSLSPSLSLSLSLSPRSLSPRSLSPLSLIPYTDSDGTLTKRGEPSIAGAYSNTSFWNVDMTCSLQPCWNMYVCSKKDREVV